MCFLTACTWQKGADDPGMSLRKNLMNGNGCSFRCKVTADYGDSISAFSMDCVSSQNEDMTFTLLAPETIQGIGGEISHGEGALTFEDKVLIVQLLADGQLTPLCSPWLMVRTLMRGVIRASGSDGEVIYDDVYSDEPFQMFAEFTEGGVPAQCAFVWQGRRILTVEVESFEIL